MTRISTASRPHGPRIRYTLARTALVALAWTGALAAQMPLTDAVPSDAFMFQHWRADPEAAFLQEHYRGVVEAFVEADFSGMIVDEILPSALSGPDLEQVRAIEALITRLLSDVPWADLGEHEIVFAMRQYAPDAALRSRGGRSDFQVFGGARVDRDALKPSYASLTRIFATAEAMKPDRVSFTILVDDGEGRRELGGTESLADAQRYLGTDAAVHCDLALLVDDSDDYGWQTLASLMFVEDKVCMTLSRDADVFAHDALAAMRGRGVERLVETDRLRNAFEGLPDGHERVYFDMPVMLSPMMQAVKMISKKEHMTNGRVAVVRDVETAIWTETFSLLDCFGTLAVTTHVENGHQVSDSVMRFRDDDSVRDNPIYLSSMTSSDVDSDDLLAFVPADTLGFSMHSGFDLVPLHDWALDRVAMYVPEAEELYIPAFRAMQGVLGIDLREELLPLIGSPSVTITVPKQSPGIDTGVGETVVVSRPSHLDASRDLERRLVTVASNMLPVALDQLGPKLRQSGVELDARIVANEGAFRSLHRLELDVGFGPMRQSVGLLFGHVGPLQVASTSEEAIAYVLETYAGEHASVLEDGPLVELGALPDGRVSSLVLTDIGTGLQQAGIGLRQAGAMMPNMLAGTGEREAIVAGKAMGGTLRRIGDIYTSLGFLGRSVMSTRVDPQTGALYSRSILEIRDD